MQNKIFAKATTTQINDHVSQFRVGDQISLEWVIAKEKDKERTQAFEGIVIAIKGIGIAKNVTIRKGVKEKGVEKTFPLHSPLLKGITVVNQGRLRQARPYYIRDLSTKALRNKVKSK